MSTDNPPRSMHEQTIADVATELGGRWARNAEVHIVGARPEWQAPRISGAGPWAVPDGAPTEPPTGYEIDAVPDMTTLDGLPPLPAPDGTNSEEE
jgi:hypothetical protein